ncbi:MAG: ribosomal protein S18-alanine N-acetyltransferase [Kofleriaceae bacterium]
MIEPATLADLDAVLEIERHSFHTAWTRETFERELATHHARIDVVRDERRVVRAFHNYWLVPASGELHVLSIAVHPDHRRRGLGGQLLAHAIEAARAIGATLATLEVRKSNAPAIALYERCGFCTVHVRARYYQDNDEDALVMTRAL